MRYILVHVSPKLGILRLMATLVHLRIITVVQLTITLIATPHCNTYQATSLLKRRESLTIPRATMTAGISTFLSYLTMYPSYPLTVPCRAHVQTIVNTMYHAHAHAHDNIPEAMSLQALFFVMHPLPCLPRCKCLLVPLVCAVCAVCSPISVSPSRPICESHEAGDPRAQADPGKIPGGSVTLSVTPCRRVVSSCSRGTLPAAGILARTTME
ncbi:hypothetical protein B0J18DRAFT_272204 [Chaetomium sp. MPI-SDFR-AT-0129]|nr:hypothetical protein B0J18DRAFT_272204 [Chaetomium sp. MPI-SDFR-AT-0129]